MEQHLVEGMLFHKTCFKCKTCGRKLDGNFGRNELGFFCMTHFHQIAKVTGGYKTGTGPTRNAVAAGLVDAMVNRQNNAVETQGQSIEPPVADRAPVVDPGVTRSQAAEISVAPTVRAEPEAPAAQAEPAAVDEVPREAETPVSADSTDQLGGVRPREEDQTTEAVPVVAEEVDSPAAAEVEVRPSAESTDQPGEIAPKIRDEVAEAIVPSPPVAKAEEPQAPESTDQPGEAEAGAREAGPTDEEPTVVAVA